MNRNLGLDANDWALRIGIISTSLILFTIGADWVHWGTLRNPLTLGLSFVAWAVGILLLITASTTHMSSRLNWAILVSLVATQLGYAYIAWLNYTPQSAYHTDNEMIAQFAVQALKRGQNPYELNFTDMLRVFRDRGTNYTPFLDGAAQNRLTYPAFPTELLLGFDLIGISSGRVVILVFHIALLILLFVGAPEILRPLVLLPMFILKDFIFLTYNGVQDIVWSALLVAVIIAWKRPVVRAVLFGLACSYRQQPWIVAPFLLIYMWKEESGSSGERFHRIVQFVAVSLGVFLLTNLPFIIWDPTAWILGAFEPAYASFNVYSSGLSVLTQFGIAELPREFYTLLQISSLLILLVAFWRHSRSVGQAFWIFPALFFWFYYRGQSNYWIYWIPPLLFALVNRQWQMPDASTGGFPRSTRWIKTSLVVGTVVAFDLIVACFLLQRPSPLEASLQLPLETTHFGASQVDSIRVTVRNKGNAIVAPRFSVQPDRGVQPLPWNINSGPDELPPGAIGHYVISADTPVKAIPLSRGGQLVVTDAHGDYANRSVITVPADSTLENPDLITNPAFLAWSSDGNHPVDWIPQVSPGDTYRAAMLPDSGLPVMVIRLDNHAPGGNLASVALDQVVTFPSVFSIWVYPTRSSTDPLRDAYGLLIEDGKHTLRILFAHTDGAGHLADGSTYVYVNSPLNTWTKQTINLLNLYDRFGWLPPSFTPRVGGGIEFSARQVHFSLLLASRSSSLGVFGSIEQDAKTFGPQALIGDALSHPDIYYANRGDEYRRQRNFDLAQSSYLRALAYDHSNPDIYYGLAESDYWLGHYAEAAQAYRSSLENGFLDAAQAYRGLGWSLYNTGEFSQARHYFEKAIELDPKLADAYTGLAWADIQSHDCQAAASNFQMARQLDPQIGGMDQALPLCKVTAQPSSTPISTSLR